MNYENFPDQIISRPSWPTTSVLFTKNTLKIKLISNDTYRQTTPWEFLQVTMTQMANRRSRKRILIHSSLKETHILHNFGCDFYGSLLKVCIVGYLRPEQNFDSLDALITAIKKDIADAERLLEDSELVKLKHHDFFKQQNGKLSSSSTEDSPQKTNGHPTTNGHL